MSKKTEVQSIKELFNDKYKLEIPPYQRAYCWGRKQWKQFIGDLIVQKPDSPYHLGQFIFETLDDEDDTKNTYYIVDGQQRLMTTVLFFSALAKVENAKELYKSYIFDKMHTIDTDDKIFSEIKNGDNIDLKDKTQSQIKMIQARNFFENELRKYTDQKRKECCEIIEEAIIGIFYVKSKPEATQVFEYQNSRGVPASQFELIKAFLMHQVYSKSANKKSKNENIKKIQVIIEDIYRSIEAVSEFFDEDHLLDRFCSIEYDVAGTLEAIKKFFTGKDEYDEEDESESEEKEKTIKIKDIFKFFNGFCEICQAAEEIVKQNSRQNIANFFFLSTEYYWDFLLFALWIKNKQAIPDDLLKLIELACIQIMLAKIDEIKINKGYLWDLSYELYHGEDTNNKELIRKLKSCVINGKYINGKDCPSINKLIGLFKKYKTEHYRYKDVTKYILLQYENKLRIEKNMKLITNKESDEDYENYDKLTIEHILARESKDDEKTDNFREYWMDCIGNMSLLTKEDNSKLKNSKVKDKKEKYKELVNEKKLIQYDEINKTIEEKGWGQKVVDTRKNKIYTFIDEYFKL